jgi:methylmalonyl-CoA mutase
MDDLLKLWMAQAERELKAGSLQTLVWHTPEGIAVKPLYTAADLEG